MPNLLHTLQNRLFTMTPSGKLQRSLFAPQLAYVQDSSDISAALCTRRAGKSVGGFSSLYFTGLKYPTSTLPYITLTRRSAKNIIWPVIKEVNCKHELGIQMKEAELAAVLPNGSQIVLHGADTEAFISRLLGGKYPGIVIDEAQAFGTHLERLVFDVLQPATLDYNGYIKLQGSPGIIPHGLFYNLTKEGTKCHRWSVLDNPYIPHAAQWLAELKQRRGWDDNNPTWRREYLGEWCYDPSALVYKFNEKINTYETLPNYDWNYIIGVDYGWNDATAFCVLAYSEHYPDAFVVDCYGYSEMIPSRVAQELQRIMAKYKPERIIADTGGLGKSITEEMRVRYELPIMAAEKTEKYMAIDALNGDFIDKRLYVHKSLHALINQMHNLTWDDKHKENPALPNDLVDGMLYSHRFSRHYWGKIPVKISQEQKFENDILHYAQQNNIRNWVDDL